MANKQIVVGKVVGVFENNKDGTPHMSKDGKPQVCISVVEEGTEDEAKKTGTFWYDYREKDKLPALLKKYGCKTKEEFIGKRVDGKLYFKIQ